MQLASILAAKGSDVATIAPQATVADLIHRLADLGIGAIIVSTDQVRITGIVSERDVVRAFASGSAGLEDPVSAIMTTRVFTATADMHVDELMLLMTEQRVRHVPVTDELGHLTGIVSIGDVVKSRLGELETERAALMDYITH